LLSRSDNAPFLPASEESQIALNLTVVIPVLNAATTVGETLGTIQGVAEIIVVDGGSDDLTKAIAKQHGASLIDAPRGRGCQLAAGAKAACGDWLLFLHADTRLAAHWYAAAEAFAADPGNKARAATFRFRLDDDCWQARMLERMVYVRTRALGLPYGDQGLLIHRDFYASVGGYPDWPIMEDVELVRRIGRRRLAMLPVCAVTSAERWRRDGWLARSLRNVLCLTLFYVGIPPRAIVRLYG
jgi:rSAM/selenodomain-associated transferase 2